MKPEVVAEAKRSMSKAEFEQEYMASFNSFEGQIYNFSEDCIQEFTHVDGCEYFAGLDPGYRDPTAFIAIAYIPSLDKFHVVDEYQNAESVTEGHAKAIQELVTKHQIDPIFIDAAAAQFAADLAYTYNLASIKAKKQVLEGIAFVQTIIEQDRLLVSPHCTVTLAMLDQYRWDTRETLTTEKPTHDIHSHIADALRYALYTFIV
jgi:phage terminase large subunit